MHDDYKYGLSTIPDEEFEKYSLICERKGVRYSVYAKVPFVDEIHGKFYSEQEALHYGTNLDYPKLSIPYYRVEYSFNLWGSTYFHTFDVLFSPSVMIEKKHLSNRMRKVARAGPSMLIHVLKFNPPDERMLTLNLPSQVMIFDVRKMVRVFD
jgi:hypothetical protein